VHRRFSYLLTFTLLTLLFTQCSLFRRGGKGDEDKKPEGDVVIGSIEMVNPEQKFVLIRTNAPLVIPAGSKLFSYSPSGLKAILKVSPERKLSLLAADIEEGYPQRGLPVFMTLENAQAHAEAATAQQNTVTPGVAPPPDPTLHWGGVPSPSGETLHWGGPPGQSGSSPSAPSDSDSSRAAGQEPSSLPAVP